jgi:hypothetical protein
MRPHPALFAVAAWLLLAAGPAWAQPQPAVPDQTRGERLSLRKLHFEFGLIGQCGFADDLTKAGYELEADRLERQLGIDHDPEARFRELNQGWTEANAKWAAAGGDAFADACRTDAMAARDRFRRAFEETGQTLKASPPPAAPRSK